MHPAQHGYEKQGDEESKHQGSKDKMQLFEDIKNQWYYQYQQEFVCRTLIVDAHKQIIV
jgi:hypothetical protein